MKKTQGNFLVLDYGNNGYSHNFFDTEEEVKQYISEYLLFEASIYQLREDLTNESNNDEH